MPLVSPILQGAFEDYNHAIEHLRRGSPLDLKYSVLHAASSVELVLKEKLRRDGVSIFENKPPYHSLGFYDCVHRLGSQNIPFYADLEILNQHRNLIVHLGNKPDSDQAKWLLNVANKFMLRFCREQLDVSADEYLRVEPIPIRPPEETYLENAKSAIYSQRYGDALFYSSAAIEYWTRNLYSFLTTKPVAELKRKSFLDFLRHLDEDQLLDRQDLARLQELYDMRNQTAHAFKVPSKTEAEQAVGTADEIAAWVRNNIDEGTKAEELVSIALRNQNVAYERNARVGDTEVDIAIPDSKDPKFLVEIKILRPRKHHIIGRKLFLPFLLMKQRYPQSKTILITSYPDSISKEVRNSVDAVFDIRDMEGFVKFAKTKRRIYITHCSAKKDDSLRNTGRKVTPDRLYTAKPTQRFMKRCREMQVEWAIFSDLYGVWFPDVEHEWYEKDPDKVTEEEFLALLRDFEEKLRDYNEICFYHNPGRFHPLYRRLLNETGLKNKITLFSHLKEIA